MRHVSQCHMERNSFLQRMQLKKLLSRIFPGGFGEGTPKKKEKKCSHTSALCALSLCPQMIVGKSKLCSTGRLVQNMPNILYGLFPWCKTHTHRACTGFAQGRQQCDRLFQFKPVHQITFFRFFCLPSRKGKSGYQYQHRRPVDPAQSLSSSQHG